MPPKAWNAKRERQYEHIKDSLEDRGTSEDKAEEIAARTVNKERARSGEARMSSRLSRTDISAEGTEVWLTGYGLVKVFKIVAPDGDIAYWASDDLTMSALTRQQLAEWGWAIETYHRGIKQNTEVEGCQARSAVAQRNHIGLALRAFLRLEWHLFSTGISWAEAKASIIRDAVRAYLAHPWITLPTA